LKASDAKGYFWGKAKASSIEEEKWNLKYIRTFWDIEASLANHVEVVVCVSVIDVTIEQSFVSSLSGS